MSLAPVIAIDGPSASGKGTVAAKVAESLGFHFLDSGALYRLVGYAALERRVALDAVDELAAIARALGCRFDGGRITLEGGDVTDAIRAEPVSAAASSFGPGETQAGTASYSGLSPACATVPKHSSASANTTRKTIEKPPFRRPRLAPPTAAASAQREWK